jgi:uncharacterized protein
MLITPAYTSIFGLVFVVLSFRTLLLRRKLGIAIGDDNEPSLRRAARAHSNFAEYVPLSLILIYFLELQTASDVWIHNICILLLVGRIIHAIGISSLNENYRYRVTGMALTFFVIIFTSFRLLIAYI